MSSTYRDAANKIRENLNLPMDEDHYEDHMIAGPLMRLVADLINIIFDLREENIRLRDEVKNGRSVQTPAGEDRSQDH